MDSATDSIKQDLRHKLERGWNNSGISTDLLPKESDYRKGSWIIQNRREFSNPQAWQRGAGFALLNKSANSQSQQTPPNILLFPDQHRYDWVGSNLRSCPHSGTGLTGWG